MVREIQSSGDQENTIRLPELSRTVKTAGVIGLIVFEVVAPLNQVVAGFILSAF